MVRVGPVIGEREGSLSVLTGGCLNDAFASGSVLILVTATAECGV